MKFPHSYNAITADFELEPVLEDYFAKYPNGNYTSYQIVYKTIDEHAPGEFSYLIIFDRNQAPHPKTVTVYEFLRAYCICENRTAASLGGGHVLPKLDGSGHLYGHPKKYERRA